MAKDDTKELAAGLMEILVIPITVVVSIVCHVLIRNHFRKVGGFTEKVKRMQTRLSTSIYLQGVIHSVLVLGVALIIPFNLLVAVLTNDYGTMLTFAVYYNLESAANHPRVRRTREDSKYV
ncbi:hypothetical protein RB195_009627 [Necator americanus]